MPNTYFQFKQFIIHQDRTAMKVTTDSCLFGAWIAEKVKREKILDINVLDIGAGTGLLSLMLAQKVPKTTIDAIEIDDNAFRQAKENSSASPFPNNIHLFHADAKNYSFEKKYDLIISNPPFYEDELKSESTRKNIAHHGDELNLIELFGLIKNNLTQHGKFFLLLPYKRQTEFMKLIDDYRFSIEEILFVRQSVNHNYFRMMICGSVQRDKNSNTIISDISIWDEKKQYTEEFVELLKDYYLYL